MARDGTEPPDRTPRPRAGGRAPQPSPNGAPISKPSEEPPARTAGRTAASTVPAEGVEHRTGGLGAGGMASPPVAALESDPRGREGQKTAEPPSTDLDSDVAVTLQQLRS